MTNKKIIKKMKEEQKAKLKKKQKIFIMQEISVSFILAFMLLCLLVILTIYSFSNKSDNTLQLRLTIVSIITTFLFEGYEWFYMFKKNKENRHPLFPCAIAFVFIIVFLILNLFIPLQSLKIESNNLLSSITLILYIILITSRKIIEDFISFS